MPPRHRQNHCYAPGCHTGYVFVKGGPKLSLFGVPKDEARRKLWEKNLHRADKPLDDTSAVCELHFEPRYVSRDYVHFIQGQEVRIPRGKPILSADAVPTILPNLPAYLTKKPPKERVSRKRKRSGTSNDSSKHGMCSGGSSSLTAPPCEPYDADGGREEPSAEPLQRNAEENPPAQCDEPYMACCYGLEMPSPYWSQHDFPDHDGVVYCTATLTSGEVHSEKVVVFFKSPSGTYCKVHARGVLLKESPVRSKVEAEEVLKKN